MGEDIVMGFVLEEGNGNVLKCIFIFFFWEEVEILLEEVEILLEVLLSGVELMVGRMLKEKKSKKGMDRLGKFKGCFGVGMGDGGGLNKFLLVLVFYVFDERLVVKFLLI